jgi:hypothetical protein
VAFSVGDSCALIHEDERPALLEFLAGRDSDIDIEAPYTLASRASADDWPAARLRAFTTPRLPIDACDGAARHLQPIPDTVLASPV